MPPNAQFLFVGEHCFKWRKTEYGFQLNNNDHHNDDSDEKEKED